MGDATHRKKGISMTETLHIKGMSCGHCVKAVEMALKEIPGVHHVQVDLATGTATVETASALDRETVRRKIEKAGYELV